MKVASEKPERLDEKDDENRDKSGDEGDGRDGDRGHVEDVKLLVDPSFWLEGLETKDIEVERGGRAGLFDVFLIVLASWY